VAYGIAATSLRTTADNRLDVNYGFVWRICELRVLQPMQTTGIVLTALGGTALTAGLVARKLTPKEASHE
jgi:ABC-type transporter Mla maintaining outer membrane lipid asymmetry permease subunit MlaE